MSDLRIENLSKSFGATPVLRSISLEIAAGAFTVIVGPSGCGKSTLLRVIAGLEQPGKGSIAIGGRDVTQLAPAERRIAMVFQSYALYPHMDVYKNMAFGLKFAGLDTKEIDTRVHQAAKMLQLDDLLTRRPAELSGGQRQRTAIGRAIVREPDVFLFDEPLSNLDAALRINTRLEIAALHQTLDATMVYVTHDQVEAMTLADQIVVMNDGSIEQVGTPLELYRTPGNLFVAGFIGAPKMNFITGPEAKRLGAETLGLRPEHIYLSGTEGEWPATVSMVEHLGADSFVHADADGIGALVIRDRGDSALRTGDRIQLRPDHEFAHRFDAQGQRTTTPRSSQD